VFEASLESVANERDFYRVAELSKEEIDFIKTVVIEPSATPFQSLHIDLINTFQFPHELRRYTQLVGSKVPATEKMIEEAVNNLQEDFHGRIEADSIAYLDFIKAGNTKFFDTKDGCLGFAYFLCVQYTRTKRMKVRLLAGVTPIENVNLEKVWGVLSHIIATNVGGSIFVDRAKYRLVLLDNCSENQFITGDQPVVNIFATGDPKNPPQQLELYYPVSPTKAVLLTERQEYQNEQRRSVGRVEITYYNEQILKNRHEQMYAASREALEDYLHTSAYA